MASECPRRDSAPPLDYVVRHDLLFSEIRAELLASHSRLPSSLALASRHPLGENASPPVAWQIRSASAGNTGTSVSRRSRDITRKLMRNQAFRARQPTAAAHGILGQCHSTGIGIAHLALGAGTPCLHSAPCHPILLPITTIRNAPCSWLTAAEPAALAPKTGCYRPVTAAMSPKPRCGYRCHGSKNVVNLE